MILIFLLFLIGCQGNDPTHDAALKRRNQKGEYLYRKHDEVTLIPPMQPITQLAYAWEKNGANGLAKITKEYFRCKGSTMSPPRTEHLRGEVVKYHDCGGSTKHSLPLRNGQEFIYPILIDLLNHIQAKTGKKVVITSGFRCPDHNTYVDPTPSNQTSKHQIGAEVDFYVQGMENQPEAVLKIIFDYYKNNPKKDLCEFKRYEKADTNVSTKPWMNKELFIKLYKRTEGRNLDNRHPYPYVSIQVRYDTQKNERVSYSWDQAFRNFLRY